MFGPGFLLFSLMAGGTLGSTKEWGHQTFLDISMQSKAKPLERKLSFPEKRIILLLV